MGDEIGRPGQASRQHRRDHGGRPDFRAQRTAVDRIGRERRFRAGFLERRQRDGSCFGNCANTDLMFASWAPCRRSTRRLAPFSFEVFALVAALNDGLNASAPQLPTWNGLARLWLAPNVEVSADSVASGPQLVGLNRKFGRVDGDAEVLQPQRHALTIVGRRSSAITRPLCDVDADRHPQSRPCCRGRTARPRPAPGSTVRRARRCRDRSGRPAPRTHTVRSQPRRRRSPCRSGCRAAHVPACACGSPHSVTDGIAPTKPAGSTVVRLRQVLLAVRPRQVERVGGVRAGVRR